MPTVDATPIPYAGIVQVDVDARDIGAEFVRLERVLVDTGEVAIVRPNTSYTGDFMETSNRFARFYDTDAPTDRTFYYQVVSAAQPEVAWPGVRAVDAVSVIDTFGRTVAAGPSWGTPDVGNAWTSAFTTTTEALVGGGEGTLSMGTEDVLRGQHIDGGTFREDWSVRYRIGLDITAPTGGNILQWTYLRMDNAVQNYVAVAVEFRTSSVIGWQVSKSVGGTPSNIGSGLTTFVNSVANGAEVRVQAVGNWLRFKIWSQVVPVEPDEWTFEIMIPDVPKLGKAALTAIVPGASTTALPVVFDFDNVAAFASTAGDATQYMLDSEGYGWLRDPINPCHNVRLVTCVDTNPCSISGVSFEQGDTSGWQTQNGEIALSTTRFRGRYAGSLVADYTPPASGTGTSLPTILYTFDATAEGWVGEGTTTAARVTTPTPHDGAGMLRAQKAMGAGTEAIRFNDAQGLRNLSANGPTIGLWAMVEAGSPGTNWQAHIEVQDPAFTWVPGPNFALTPGVWRLVTFTPPAGLLANMRSIGMSIEGTGASATVNSFIDTVRQGGHVSARSARSLPVTTGRAVRAGAYLRAPVSLGARVGINWYSSTGQWVATSAGPFVTLPAGIWTLSTMVGETPAGATEARLVVQEQGTPAAGAQLLIDAAYLAYREPATDGVFLASLDEVGRAAQGQTVAVVGDALPANVALRRRAPDGSFTLVSRSFTDREALLTLLNEGTPVQLDMPEEYGIPTMTLAVGDIGEAHGLPDLRYQPRVHRLPYAQVRPPAGPTNGPCGAKYEDWCEDPNLDTWAEVTAAGLTYNQMIDVT